MPDVSSVTANLAHTNGLLNGTTFAHLYWTISYNDGTSRNIEGGPVGIYLQQSEYGLTAEASLQLNGSGTPAVGNLNVFAQNLINAADQISAGLTNNPQIYNPLTANSNTLFDAVGLDSGFSQSYMDSIVITLQTDAMNNSPYYSGTQPNVIGYQQGAQLLSSVLSVDGTTTASSSGGYFSSKPKSTLPQAY